MTDVLAQPTQCMKCGGVKMYDNTAPGAKKSPKGPDYKCANKDCGEGYWLKRGAAPIQHGGYSPVPETIVPAWLNKQAQEEAKAVTAIQAGLSYAELEDRMAQCIVSSVQLASLLRPEPFGNEDARTLAITLFIERNRRGI